MYHAGKTRCARKFSFACSYEENHEGMKKISRNV